MLFFASTFLKKLISVMAFGLVGLLLFMGGCRNCEERLCLTVKILREKSVNLSDECCRHPESEGCGPVMYKRFNRMLDLILVADDACHAGNLDVLKEVWQEFKDIVPPSWILLLCEQYQDLDEWLENDCRPYYNSAVVLGMDDLIDFDIQLIEVTGTGFLKLSSALQGSTNQAPSDAAMGARSFVVTPGSSILAETWAGSADLGVSGIFAMSDFQVNDAGFLEGTPTQLSFDFIDAENGVAGSIELDQGAGQSVVLVDVHGVGILGAAVSVDIHAIDDPDFSLEGHVDTAWIEIPVALRKRGIQLGGVGPVSGFDVTPIHSETQACLETEEEDVPVAPDAQLDPCDAVEGPNGEDWYKRSNDWYWRITSMFPQCFEDADG